MNLFPPSFRLLVVAAALTATATASQALTIPFQGTRSNSVQTFSKDAMGGFRALEIKVTPLGNATPVAGDAASFSFPVTQIVIGSKLNIAAGSAAGSALQISRMDDNDVKVGITVANFTLNYDTKQVLADTTPLGGATTVQMPLYNFTVATPLGLKYRFPLTITGHEVLNDLRLTEQAKQAMISGLELPVFAIPLLNNDFGTLTQDISTDLRWPAASTTPYTPAP